MSCSVIRSARAGLLYIFPISLSCLCWDIQDKQLVGIELATLLAAICSQGIISRAFMMEWRPAKRWCKTTGIGCMTVRVVRAHECSPEPHWANHKGGLQLNSFYWEQWENSKVNSQHHIACKKASLCDGLAKLLQFSVLKYNFKKVIKHQNI